MTIVLPQDLANPPGKPAVASDVMANFNALLSALNSGLDTTNLSPAANIAATQLAAAVQAALFAPGDVKPTASAVGAGTEPAGWLYCDGRSLLRTDQPALFSALGGASSPYGLLDGTHFNLPDYRGRGLVGKGSPAEINAVGKNEGFAVGSRSPQHTHALASHVHNVSALLASNAPSAETNIGAQPAGVGGFDVIIPNAGHTHSGGFNVNSGSPSNNTSDPGWAPYGVVNWLVKT